MLKVQNNVSRGIWFLALNIIIFSALFFQSNKPVISTDNVYKLQLHSTQSQPQPSAPNKPAKNPSDEPPILNPRQETTPKPTGYSDFKSTPFSKEVVIDREGTSSLLQGGGVVSNKNARLRALCGMKVSKACVTKYIADSIDLAVAFAPIYTIAQDYQKEMYPLHEGFVSLMKSIGIPVIVLEAIVPKRGQIYKVTRPGHEPWEIQIHIEDTFYYRENMLNVAAKKTMDVWEYMLWIDAHQIFENIYWWEEAIYKMEHFASVNFFQTLGHMDERNRTINNLIMNSVMYNYQYTRPMQGTRFFAGNAWGIRKDLYQQIGYILDTCIAGACDYSYCIASMKNINDWDGLSMFPHYYNELKPWIENTNRIFKGSSTTIRGRLSHLLHNHIFDYFGIQNRFSSGGFDIANDLTRDANFTLHLVNPALKELFPGHEAG